MSVVRQAADLDKRLAAMCSKAVPKATSRALNKSAPLAKTRTVRGVAKAKSLPMKLVRKRVYIRRSKPLQMRARITAYARGVPVIDLKARDSGKGGWRSRKGRGVRASGGRHYRNAFIANVRRNGPQVFERKGNARLPIEIKRISIVDEVNDITPKAARRVMESRFPDLLAHELSREYDILGVT